MSESTSQATCDAAAFAVGTTGFQFLPTDDKDLMAHYLLRKPRGEPLPTDLVLDGRYAYAEHPEKLVAKLGALDGAWYLFSPRQRKCAGGMKPNRETGDGVGHWKAIRKEKPILGGGADGMEVVGTKRELWYYENVYEVDGMGRRKRVRAKYKSTKWRMMEFVASNTNRPPAGDETAPDPNPMLLNDCVLCKITRRPLEVKNTGPQGEEEDADNDDNNGEEEPTSEGGGESQEKYLSEQQPASGGGGAGAQGEQQRPSPLGGAGSHGNRQPTTAEAALLDDYYPGLYVGDVADSNWCDDLIIRSIFDDHIGTAYGGGETLNAQRAWYHQAESSGGGAGSLPDEQQQPTPPDEQQQPTPEAPNEEGAAATAAASQHAVS